MLSITTHVLPLHTIERIKIFFSSVGAHVIVIKVSIKCCHHLAGGTIRVGRTHTAAEGFADRKIDVTLCYIILSGVGWKHAILHSVESDGPIVTPEKYFDDGMRSKHEEHQWKLIVYYTVSYQHFVFLRLDRKKVTRQGHKKIKMNTISNVIGNQQDMGSLEISSLS